MVFGPAVEEPALICEAVRTVVEAYPWTRIAAGLSVTVSVGLAPAGDGADVAAVVAADECLIEAKRAGRNRVVRR